MTLVVIRHGQAGDPADWKGKGKDDRLRPLTPPGKKQMRRAIAGLATLVDQIDILASSPLVRAAQSAEIVAAEYKSDIVTVEALEPDADPDAAVQWLKEVGSDQTVAVVGHEPHLSGLICYLVTGKRVSFIDLKKSGVAILDLGGAPTPGRAVLQSLLTPGLLRRLS
jgi:phosphohistidine phosphatase